jgi:hypothetical protein
VHRSRLNAFELRINTQQITFMKRLACFGISLMFVVRAAVAQDEISWFTLAGGGSTANSGNLMGTIGQPAAGRAQAGSYTLVGGFWSFGTTVADHHPPTLRLTREGNQVVLAWPDWAVSYQLQISPSLVTPTWEDVINTPSVVASEFQVTLRLQPGNAFFRLRAP